MKIISSFSTMVIMTLASTFSVQAQEKKTEEKINTQEVTTKPQENKDRLGLTYSQQTPYREIIKRYAEEMREVRKSVLSREEKIEKLKLIDLKREAEIKSLLTVEQFKIYLELKEEKKSKMLDMRKQNNLK
jgi:hypothetical protein